MRGKNQRIFSGKKSQFWMSQNGQITVEFMVALGVIALIFSSSLYVFSEKNSGFAYSKESFNAGLLARELSSCINATLLAGDGAETTVLLKDKGDFNISVSSGSVRVFYGSEYASSKILTGRVAIKSLSLGGRVNVKNRSGGIVIENA